MQKLCFHYFLAPILQLRSKIGVIVMKKATSSHLVYACLPFVELAQQACIQMGPVSFWPASRFKEFIDPNLQNNFQNYLNSMSQIKAATEKNTAFINTVKLEPHGNTYISIDQGVAKEHKEQLLVDSLYLLYFACTFRNLYYNNEIPKFGPFRKMIPADLEFIQEPANWSHLHIAETDREETVCIHLVDQEFCDALGKMLSAIYLPNQAIAQEIIHDYKRFIRAIRYLVDRFFQRFVNLFEKGLKLPEIIFEPEDVIFLASSFEALFDLDERHATADFKAKLRPLLHMKHSKPIEIFWKWVDDFYEVRHKIVHSGMTPDPIFKLNPNFEISHILIGIKLFIYSAYYSLYKYNLLHSVSSDAYNPPDFKWIHPEEILLLFWTEKHLLRKLSHFLKRIIEDKVDHQEELLADVHLLASLFVSMQERYYYSHYLGDVKFIPCSLQELQKEGFQILALLEKSTHDRAFHKNLLKSIPTHFIDYLKVRLEDHFHEKLA
jgi:hypothetical protein